MGITKFAIVSDKEKETILKYWNELQYQNELQFEKDYIECVARRNEKEQQSEEDGEEM